MDIVSNQDHRMPQNIDVFQHIEDCARRRVCCVWGCSNMADVQSNELAPGATMNFEVPFCIEHAKGFRAVHDKSIAGELDA